MATFIAVAGNAWERFPQSKEGIDQVYLFFKDATEGGQPVHDSSFIPKLYSEEAPGQNRKLVWIGKELLVRKEAQIEYSYGDYLDW